MPSPDPQTLSEVREIRDNLIKTLKKLVICERKTPAPLPLTSAVQEQRNNTLEEESKASLFRLAKDEVATAMQIADEGEKIAKNLKSMNKRSLAFQSLTDLRMGGEKVLKAAKAAVSAPDDLAAQQSFSSAQKELGVGVRNVFGAVCVDSEEVNLSVQAVENALNDEGKTAIADRVFQAAREVLEEIARGFPNEGPSSEVQEVMIRAREVCSKSSKMVTEIRTLAKEKRAQDLKSTLGTAAKLLNDRAIRIKIISIVKLSSGQGNDDVSIAVAGLEIEINNIVNSLRGELLRLKLATAVNQVTAIKSALGVLKSHAAQG